MLTNIIAIAVALYLIATGCATLFTGKTIGIKADYYTQESIKKFTRPCGILTLFLGLSLFISALGLLNVLPEVFVFIGMIAVIIFSIIYYIVMKKTLVKEK